MQSDAVGDEPQPTVVNARTESPETQADIRIFRNPLGVAFFKQCLSFDVFCMTSLGHFHRASPFAYFDRGEQPRDSGILPRLASLILPHLAEYSCIIRIP